MLNLAETPLSMSPSANPGNLHIHDGAFPVQAPLDRYMIPEHIWQAYYQRHRTSGHDQAFKCVEQFKKEYKPEDNCGIAWIQLKKSLQDCLYDALKDAIVQEYKKGLSPKMITKFIKAKYHIAFKESKMSRKVEEWSKDPLDPFPYRSYRTRYARVDSANSHVLPDLHATKPRKYTYFPTIREDKEHIEARSPASMSWLDAFALTEFLHHPGNEYLGDGIAELNDVVTTTFAQPPLLATQTPVVDTPLESDDDWLAKYSSQNFSSMVQDHPSSSAVHGGTIHLLNSSSHTSTNATGPSAGCETAMWNVTERIKGCRDRFSHLEYEAVPKVSSKNKEIGHLEEQTQQLENGPWPELHASAGKDSVIAQLQDELKRAKEVKKSDAAQVIALKGQNTRLRELLRDKDNELASLKLSWVQSIKDEGPGSKRRRQSTLNSRESFSSSGFHSPSPMYELSRQNSSSSEGNVIIKFAESRFSNVPSMLRQNSNDTPGSIAALTQQLAIQTGTAMGPNEPAQHL